MNDINRLGGGAFARTGYETADETGYAPGDATLQKARQNPVQVLEEMDPSTPPTITPGAGGTGSGHSLVTNANGAPQIEGVAIGFSAEDMAAALAALQSKTMDAQIATAKEGIKTNKKKLEDQNQRALDKIQDWIKKCQKESAKAKGSRILGWFKRAFTALAAVFAVAAAGIATVASGGAATPVLALALLALTASIVDIVSAVQKERGGKGLDHVLKFLDPGSLIGQGFGKLAKAFGADEKQEAIVAAVFGAVATIAIAIACVAITGGADVTNATQKLILSGARIGQAITGIADGATQITKGSVDFAAAFDRKAADMALADKKSIDAIIAQLQKHMEDEREDLKKVLTALMDNANIVSQIINAAGQTRSQLSANLSAGKALA